MTKITLHKVKRKRGAVWMLRWYDSRRRRCGETIGKVGVMTKRQAEAVRRVRQGRADTGLVTLDRPARMTLHTFLQHDRDAIQADVKPATLIEHDNAGKHAKAVLGDEIPLTAITRGHVGQIKQHLLDKGRATATIRKTIVTLRAMFSRAQAEALIVDNPFAGQKLAKVQPKQKRIYRPEEITCMVEVAPDQWWETFITLAATSGLRKSELLNLTWRDLDFGAGVATVSAKRAGTFTVAEADYPILAWSSKSSRERIVPLPPNTLAMLGRFQMKGGGSPYVFLTLARLAALAPRIAASHLPPSINLVNNLNRHFDQIQVAARALLAKRRGVELDAVEWSIGTIHDLRKTYATTMAQVVPMHELRDLLGHSNITTTAEYYTAPSDTVAEKVRAAFAQAG